MSKDKGEVDAKLMSLVIQAHKRIAGYGCLALHMHPDIPLPIHPHAQLFSNKQQATTCLVGIIFYDGFAGRPGEIRIYRGVDMDTYMVMDVGIDTDIFVVMTIAAQAWTWNGHGHAHVHTHRHMSRH
jgi:hypothetical protein